MSTKDDRKDRYGKPSRKLDTDRLSFIATDRATKRVIAPYVNIIRRGRKIPPKVDEDNKFFSFYLQKKPSLLTRNLKEFLDSTVELPTLLHESIESLRRATNSIGVRLYLVDETSHEIFVSPKNNPLPQHRICFAIQEGRTVAGHVASTLDYVVVKDIIADPRFSEGVPFVDPTVKSVLCAPIIQPDGNCYGVVELCRDVLQPSYRKSDVKLLLILVGWMGSSIFRNQEQTLSHQQEKLSDCLIELTKCYFAENISLDNVISEIVSFAKSAVGAEKTVFFVLVPGEDMLADVYDEGTEYSNHHGVVFKRSGKVRLNKDKSIVGYVAKTAECINIRDAYNDPRFNKELDQKTGRITRSVLCIPISGASGVLGILEAVNKVNGLCFTKTDEAIFKTFAVYGALTLHFHNLSERSQSSHAKYSIAMGLLRRHMMPCEHDILKFQQNLMFDYNINDICSYSWYIDMEKVDQIPQIAFHLIVMVVGENELDCAQLQKFLLTVRRFYRSNPYHNWEHAFNVFHCMAMILLDNRELFTDIEKKALLIAALGHDVDHGGVTNSFLHISSDVLTQLYSESPWEHHHYTLTMMILNEIPVFKNLMGFQYRDMCDVVKNAILATDLVTYFKVKSKLGPIVKENMFELTNPVHKTMLKSVMMTSCDLSGQCKPFDVARRLTQMLYKEFYHQGDIEKEMGYVPLSMMDREKQQLIPADQVQFLNILVMPCTDLLHRCLSNTYPLYSQAVQLRGIWEDITNMKDVVYWRQEASVVNTTYKDEYLKYPK